MVNNMNTYCKWDSVDDEKERVQNNVPHSSDKSSIV